MNSNYYKAGSWNVHCMRCGFKRKAEDIRKEWTGLLVCSDTCWEPRHPQDFLRGVEDKQSVPFTNKDPVVFVDVTYGPGDAEFDAFVLNNLPVMDRVTHDKPTPVLPIDPPVVINHYYQSDYGPADYVQ